MLDEKSLIEEAGVEADVQQDKYLTFVINGQDYGIDIRYVTEIIGIQKITELPELLNFVKGVINLRGKVIPIIDVRLRFGFPEREYDERTCIIVVDMNESSIGLVVDSVNEVLDIPSSQIDPPPKVKKGKENRFIQGLGKVEDSVKILLDVHKLLFDEELEAIESALTGQE